MRIRPMTRADAAAVAALVGQLGYPTTPERMAGRFDLLAGDTAHALFVAEVAGEPATGEPLAGESVAGEPLAGWVHVHGVLLLEADPRAEIWGLVVDAAHRGRGIGRALMDRAEAWARGRGYTEIRLHSNVVRAAAHRFYQDLGYRITKSSYVFEKSLAAPSVTPSTAEGSQPV
jgi:ribosomal protein S18 acetylase RimI-like enzyme